MVSSIKFDTTSSGLLAVDIGFHLRGEGVGIARVYGIAFTFEYSTTSTKFAEPMLVNFEDTWLTEGGNPITLYENFHAEQKVDIAVVRTDLINAKVLADCFTDQRSIIEIADANEPTEDSITMAITNVLLLDSAGIEIPVGDVKTKVKFLPEVLSGQMAYTQTDCNDIVAYADAFNGVKPYSYIWVNALGDTVGTDSIVAELSYGEYILSITDAVDSSFSLPFFIPGDTVAPVISNCPGDTAFCGGTVSWAPPTVEDNCLDTMVTNHPPGSIFTEDTVVTIIYTAADLSGNSAQCSFTVTTYPTPIATVAGDAHICPGESTWLGGLPAFTNSTLPSIYEWSPVTGLSASTVANPLATPDTSTLYTLVVSDTRCTDTAQVSIFVDTIPPEIIGCPDDIPSCSPVTAFHTPTVSDN